eukprot:tig00000219_g19459.t1
MAFATADWPGRRWLLAGLLVLAAVVPAALGDGGFKALRLQPGESPSSETGVSQAAVGGKLIFAYEPAPGVTALSHILTMPIGSLPDNDAELGKVPLPNYRVRTVMQWNDTFVGVFAGHYGSVYKYHTLLLIDNTPKVAAEIDFSSAFKGAVHSARATGRPDEVMIQTIKPDGQSGYNLHRCQLDYSQPGGIAPRCEVYIQSQADFTMDLVDIVDGLAYIVHAPVNPTAPGRGSEVLVVDTRLPPESPTAERVKAQLESRTLPGRPYIFRGNTFGAAVFDRATQELIVHAVDAQDPVNGDHFLLHIATAASPMALAKAVKLPASAPRDVQAMAIDPASGRVHFLALPSSSLAVYTYTVATGGVCSQAPEVSSERPPAARSLLIANGVMYVGSAGQDGSGSWLLAASLPLPDCGSGSPPVEEVHPDVGPPPPAQQEEAAAETTGKGRSADASDSDDFNERTSFIVVGGFAILCLLLFLCSRAFVSKESS